LQRFVQGFHEYVVPHAGTDVRPERLALLRVPVGLDAHLDPDADQTGDGPAGPIRQRAVVDDVELRSAVDTDLNDLGLIRKCLGADQQQRCWQHRYPTQGHSSARLVFIVLRKIGHIFRPCRYDPRWPVRSQATASQQKKAGT
jgi:hypothetical protein